MGTSIRLRTWACMRGRLFYSGFRAAATKREKPFASRMYSKDPFGALRYTEQIPFELHPTLPFVSLVSDNVAGQCSNRLDPWVDAQYRTEEG